MKQKKSTELKWHNPGIECTLPKKSRFCQMSLIQIVVPLLALYTGTSNRSFANEPSPPPHFGLTSSSCSSLGGYTQRALTQAASLRDVANRIRSDQNCGAIKTALEQMVTLTNSMNEEMHRNNPPQRSEAPLTNPTTAAVIRSTTPQDFLTSLLKFPVEGERGAQVLLEASKLAQNGQTNYINRRNAAIVGLRGFRTVLHQLDSLDRCTSGSGDAVLGSVLGSLVHIAAVSAGTDGSIVQEFAQSLQSLGEVLRTDRVRAALRTLDQTGFVLSISCLLESVSETYCSAVDAHQMLGRTLELMRSPSQRAGRESRLTRCNRAAFGAEEMLECSRRAIHETNETANPFEARVIMDRDVRNFARWLYDLIYAVSIRSNAQATQTNLVIRNRNIFDQKRNSALGLLAEESRVFDRASGRTLTTTSLLHLVERISSAISGNEEGGGRNYFSVVHNPANFGFYLLGSEDAGASLGFTCNVEYGGCWSQFRTAVAANRIQQMPAEMNQTQLNSLLHQTIPARFQQLSDMATRQADDNFRSQLNFDSPTIALRAISGRISPLDSAMNINGYLSRLKTRLTHSSRMRNAEAAIPAIEDLQAKLNRIIHAASAIRTAQTLPRHENRIALYDTLINTARDEFRTAETYDSVFTGRMQQFIEIDYSEQFHNPHQTLHQYSEFLGAHNLWNLSSALGEIHENFNFIDLQNDLISAQTVNSTNLSAYESLFGDILFPNLTRIRAIESRQPQGWAYFSQEVARLLGPDPRYAQLSREQSAGLVLRALFMPQTFLAEFAQTTFWDNNPIVSVARGLYRYLGHSDRYDLRLPSRNQIDISPGVTGAWTLIRQRICIQTAGFQNYAQYRSLCENIGSFTSFGASTSYHNLVQARADADNVMNGDSLQSLRTFTREGRSQAQRNAGAAHHRAVCALRDHRLKSISRQFDHALSR